MDLAFATLLGSACTLLVYACNRHVRGFLPDDLPRPGRKQHDRPIPLAGVALLPPTLVILLLAGQVWTAAAATAVAAVGFVDDWRKELGRDLDWRCKLAVHAVAGGAIAGAAFAPPEQPLLFALTWLFAIVLTNAANFLDNTDGVTAAMLGTGLLLTGQPTAMAIGMVSIAFLPWNWPRPRLFLGDSGAYLLGLCAADAVARQLPAPTAVAPFALVLADFVQVVIARIALGVAPWIGDRRHLTHIVQNLGVPRTLVAPLFAAGTAAIGLALRAGW